MKKLIHSIQGKYIVNILMVIILAMLLVNTYLKGEGEKHGKREFRPHHALNEQEKVSTAQTSQAAVFDLPGNNRPGEGHRGNGDHKILGIIWLVLMLLHTIQHWAWFKKILSPNNIMKDKLLSATLLAFFLFSITSILLLTDALPGFRAIREFHEFLGPVTAGLVAIHVFQRINWYVKTTRAIMR